MMTRTRRRLDNEDCYGGGDNKDIDEEDDGDDDDDGEDDDENDEDDKENEDERDDDDDGDDDDDDDDDDYDNFGDGDDGQAWRWKPQLRLPAISNRTPAPQCSMSSFLLPPPNTRTTLNPKPPDQGKLLLSIRIFGRDEVTGLRELPTPKAQSRVLQTSST